MSDEQRHAEFVQGPTAVRKDILEYLKVQFPKVVEDANSQWDSDAPLVAPRKWSLYEPLGISHRTGPLLGIGVSNSPSRRPVDFSGALELEMLTRYNVRLYLWCYTPEYTTELVPDDAREQALRLRDDLSTLLRAMLISYPGMHKPGTYQIQTGTITEDYSDATQTGNNSGRYIAAVVVSFGIDVEERLHSPALGFVSNEDDDAPGVDVNGSLLGGSQ